MTERTLVFLKPAGLELFENQIVTKLADAGALVGCGMFVPSRERMEKHYAVHRDRDFFASLVEYHAGKEMFALVLEGEDVISRVRKLCGATLPKDAAPGTIRALGAGMFPDVEAWDVLRRQGKNADNLVHSSDSHGSAAYEIQLWFPHLKP